MDRDLIVTSSKPQTVQHLTVSHGSHQKSHSLYDFHGHVHDLSEQSRCGQHPAGLGSRVFPDFPSFWPYGNLKKIVNLQLQMVANICNTPFPPKLQGALTCTLAKTIQDYHQILMYISYYECSLWHGLLLGKRRTQITNTNSDCSLQLQVEWSYRA